jgi:hypothetical protein
MSLLLMVHHPEVQGMRSVDLCGFLGLLLQLPVSHFSCNDKVMEDMGNKVGRMLNPEQAVAER